MDDASNDDIQIVATDTAGSALGTNVDSNLNEDPSDQITDPVELPPLDVEPVAVEGWFVVFVICLSIFVHAVKILRFVSLNSYSKISFIKHIFDLCLRVFFCFLVEVECNDHIPCRGEQESVILVQTDANQRQSTFPLVHLLINRSTLLKDMIEAFSNPCVLTSTLFVKVKDTNGKNEAGEGRGVLREVLTDFWCQFYQSLAVGASSKVPVIRHDYQKEQWKAIARILLYGYCTEGIFPLSLSPIFISSCIHGEDSITQEMLLEAFKMYVSEDEKETITNCLESHSNLSSDEVMEFLSSYKCYRSPSKENIHEIICQLAHQELIQRPRYVSNCWSPILQSLKSVNRFHNATEVQAFYDEIKPTPKKVVKMLKASPKNDIERNIYDHLKRFIKSLGANVAAFLQFTTGSSVILDNTQLEVSFTELRGFARRPVVHTCGPLLELPCTYQCYNELVEEFSAILQQKSSWTFDII